MVKTNDTKLFLLQLDKSCQCQGLLEQEFVIMEEEQQEQKVLPGQPAQERTEEDHGDIEEEPMDRDDPGEPEAPEAVFLKQEQREEG